MIIEWLSRVLLKKNTKATSKDVIVSQLNEMRPLPVGRKEFEEWSDRIISGTLLPATPESQKFALCNMILSLGPTESNKPDAHFIYGLRKFAANQVADTIRLEIRDTAKKRLEEAERAQAEAGNLVDTSKGLTLVPKEILDHKKV